MPRRRRDPPDNRLDWRDPDMPCLGWYKGVATVPEIVQREAAYNIKFDYNKPWHSDPLYFAAERKRARRRTPT